MIGTGNLAQVFLQALEHQGWEVEKVLAFDTNDLAVTQFCEHVKSQFAGEVVPASTLNQAVTHSDVIFLIVDDIDHVLAAKTSPHLTYLKYGHHRFINGTWGGLLTGKCQIDTTRTTICSPMGMGMGILDLAIAHSLFDEAARRKMIIQVNNFYLP